MSTKSISRPDSAKVVPLTTKPPNVDKLLQQYGTGEIPFAGTQDGIYDRHLVFDRAIDPKAARRIFILHALVRGEYGFSCVRTWRRPAL